MKKRLMSLFISFILIFSTFSMIGCGGGTGDLVLYQDGMTYTVTEKGEALPVYALSYDIMGGSDVMPVGGYYGLYSSGGSINGNNYPTWIQDKYFGLMSEIGINMIVYVSDRNNGYAPLYKKWYELGEKYGIGIFANSSTFESYVGTRTGDPLLTKSRMTAQELYDLVRKVAFDFQYKSFLGLWAMDEAYANHQLRELNYLVPLFYNCGLPEGIDAYMNSIGYWEGETNVSNTFTGGGWTFEEYYFTGKKGQTEDGASFDIPGYLNTGVRMISSTQYPVTSAERDDENFSDWFQTLAIFCDESYKYGAPYWRMMQAGAEFYKANPVPLYPTEGQWMLDYNSALAFGCKAIQYYELCGDEGHNTNQDGSWAFDKNGMVGMDGKVNNWWYYAKNADKQLKAIDHVLMHATNVGMMPHGEQATAMLGELELRDGSSMLIPTKSWRELKSVKGDDVIIGCFDYKGGTALYVVNSNVEENATTTFNFKDKYRYEVTQRGQMVDVVGTSIPLTLAPGEGALIVLH